MDYLLITNRNYFKRAKTLGTWILEMAIYIYMRKQSWYFKENWYRRDPDSVGRI